MGKTISVNINEFSREYNRAIPFELFIKMQQALIDGADEYELSEEVVEEIKSRHEG